MRKIAGRLKTWYSHKHALVFGVGVMLLVGVYFGVPFMLKTTYSLGEVTDGEANIAGADKQAAVEYAPHLPTPEAVKGLYMTACVAATPAWRERLTRLVEETELNTLIIDVKDYTGGVSFDVDDPRFDQAEHANCFVSDMREWLSELHERGIYTVARITVFQDPLYAQAHPDVAVQRQSDKSVWKDNKGLSFVDAGAKGFWDYIATLAEASYRAGFDELNFDYIRFPSDGDMRDIYYPISENTVMADITYGKAAVVRSFFSYIHDRLTALESPSGEGRPILSADLFGMTTTNPDDLNIGQVLEDALPYFDYVAPMVYPSHYPSGFIGLSNPAAYPYEVIKHSMDRAVGRTRIVSNGSYTDTATTSASSSVPVHKTAQDRSREKLTEAQRRRISPDQLRPWIQDFDLGATYDAAKVRAQIQATYDAGLDSWMLWSASNRYTESALYSNDPQ